MFYNSFGEARTIFHLIYNQKFFKNNKLLYKLHLWKGQVKKKEKRSCLVYTYLKSLQIERERVIQTQC